LPAPFRRDFGADLEAVLVDRLRDADGAASRAWIWLVALVDVAMTAAAEWTRIVRERQTGHVGRSVGSSDLGLDIRHAIRSLARRPGFAATAVATLAIAIGATVAIFSVVDAILLRPFRIRTPRGSSPCRNPDSGDPCRRDRSRHRPSTGVVRGSRERALVIHP
jgi:hypothetical protein